MRVRVRIEPGRLCGRVEAPPSKSHAHRLLICAALADGETLIERAGDSQDIEASVRCLNALGARICREGENLRVRPIERPAEGALLDCGESGSTLRFLLPLAALADCGATLTGRGRLPERPNEPLLRALEMHGARFAGRRVPLRAGGGLRPGEFALPGDVSSQFFTGLLLALALLQGESTLVATSPLESAPYVEMTRRAMRAFGVEAQAVRGGWRVAGGQRYRSPGRVRVEGDWSGAAFFFAANALGSAVEVGGLDPCSAQGDRAIGALVKDLNCVDVRDTPDLMPVLAATMAATPGEHLVRGAARLRIKESDRLRAMARAIRALGGEVEELPDGLRVRGGELAGGLVDACGDHRVVMACAIVATRCAHAVVIDGAEAADKSYPGFFDDFARLGGRVYVEHAG